MKRLLLACGLIAAAGTSAAQSTKVSPVISRDLAGMAGKEGVLLVVEYAPGAVDFVQHRHDANVFVYVLEGSVVMQVKGGEPVTLRPGETFHEGPSDTHVVGRNASATEPARFLAFFVKDKGAPILTPVP
jgi:quercetin dioxygenase-like cupin family protein